MTNKNIVSIPKFKYKKLPIKKIKNFCDDLWAIIVKMRDGNKCAICGSSDILNSHHLVSRRVHKYRWSIDNGITLCPTHHEFGIEFSAHTSPWALEEWMKESRQDQYKIWCDNRKNVSSEEGNIQYEEIYHELEELYKHYTGEYMRIERIQSYLLYINAESIKEMISNNIPLSEICKKTNTNSKALNDFIKLNKLDKLDKLNKPNKPNKPNKLIKQSKIKPKDQN